VKNDEIKISSGQKPDIKTGSTAQSTPFETAAAVAISGAIDHISQVTLLGNVSPLNIERM
jgi:hypothetical protein